LKQKGENKLDAADAGAHILPAMPAFCRKSATIEELTDFIVDRIMSFLEIGTELFEPWQR
jgi:4-hydroxy-3-polyprenylbenzoate decarboxylase